MNFLSLNVQGLGHKAKKRWIQELNHKHGVNFLAIQETKMETIDLFNIKAIWGNYSFNYASSASVGYSGGNLCIWDPILFKKENVTASDSFLAIRGTWLPSSTKLLIISVYAPQDHVEKRMLWDYLLHLLEGWDGEYVLMGDFNEVRSDQERFGTLFNVKGANAFNNFIALVNLIDLPLEGYSFTWSHKSAMKMSKLDRFLVSEGLTSLFPCLSALCLDKNLSDHRPILMRELIMDYGPTPFRIYHPWFSKEGFDKLVEDSWNKLVLAELNRMDSVCNEEILTERTKLQLQLNDLNSIISQEMAQKAKVCWAIEGDEISKFYHDMIHKKRSQLAIRGVFAPPPTHRLCIESQFDKVMSQEQNNDLERPISKEEIKGAVWDCRTNKSPGPDGFTFEFIRRQILDGPFILSELLSWCKQKKFKTMIFKVDFEKAFDSIRWDYLDDVLFKFGFGSKWCGWIRGCLSSSMGSVLVNGSPTTEVNFFKDLKQGDPLSPFLFIIVMESLHIAFTKVLNARIFKGIPINESLSLPYFLSLWANGRSQTFQLL
ncbi:RNA-directed DNA polymerase, eukaryota [Tanacetum coccineum]